MNLGAIHKLCREAMDEHSIPGLSLAIAREDRVLHAAGLGHRCHGRRAPVTPRTLFHMASVTKTVTTTAVFQLVEEKKLDLDRAVAEYVPEFRLADDRYHEITARHLLTHTSGLPDAESLEWENPQTEDDALQNYIAGLRRRRLAFSPGEEYQYSDISFDLLGRLVEAISTHSFEETVKHRILKPLGMRDSTLQYPLADPRRLASPHHLDNDEIMTSEIFPYNREHAPSSTLLSTAHDLARWIRCSLNRGSLGRVRILKPSAYTQMWTETHGFTGDFWTGVGLGWFLGGHDEHRLVGHEGSDCGFRAAVVLVPSVGFGLAVLVNRDGDILKPLLRRLLNQLL